MNQQMVSASDDVFSDHIAYGCSQPSGDPGALHPTEFVARARAAPLGPRRPVVGELPCGCCRPPTPLNSRPHMSPLDARPSGIWEKSPTVIAILEAYLPNLDNYQGSMAEGRGHLFGKMQDLKHILIDDGDTRYTPREAELAVIQHLKNIFGMTSEGEEHMNFEEQECARLNRVVKWLSYICLFTDKSSPIWEHMWKNQEELAKQPKKGKASLSDV